MMLHISIFTIRRAALSVALLLTSASLCLSSPAAKLSPDDTHMSIHERAINAEPDSDLGRGFTTVGPATGYGRFLNPAGGETWYVGDTQVLRWEVEDTIHPNRTNQNGLINTGMLLFSYPNTSIQQKSDYDVKHKEWNLTDHGGTLPWFITDSCVGVNKCYFNFHYFFDDSETSFAFIYSKNITILAEKPTSTSASTVSTPTGSTISQPAATTSAASDSSGGGKSNIKIIAPVAVGVSLLVIGLAIFLFIRWKKSRLQNPPDLGGYPVYKFELDAGQKNDGPDPRYAKGVELPAGHFRAHEADSNVVHELISHHHHHELSSNYKYELPANEEPQRPGASKPGVSTEIAVEMPPETPPKDK